MGLDEIRKRQAVLRRQTRYKEGAFESVCRFKETYSRRGLPQIGKLIQAALREHSIEHSWSVVLDEWPDRSREWDHPKWRRHAPRGGLSFFGGGAVSVSLPAGLSLRGARRERIAFAAVVDGPELAVFDPARPELPILIRRPLNALQDRSEFRESVLAWRSPDDNQKIASAVFDFVEGKIVSDIDPPPPPRPPRPDLTAHENEDLARRAAMAPAREQAKSALLWAVFGAFCFIPLPVALAKSVVVLGKLKMSDQGFWMASLALAISAFMSYACIVVLLSG